MTETNWNDLAEEYTRRDFPRDDWIYGYKPVLELLGDLTGKRVLDYGCGSGKFSRILANNSAKVIAVDPTEKMLELARLQNSRNIDYRRIVGNDISFIEPIDDAVATYVLCGRRSDNEAIEITRNIHRKLQVGGSFIVLDPHPINRQGADSEGLVQICLEKMCSPVLDYSRPVEKYIAVLQEGGFTVDALFEPKDEQGKPKMLIVRGRKCTV